MENLTLGITLERHDFNEPQCGKDQCDRESAIAKKLMRTYVDEGNNILDANDIKEAILYKSGVPNSKVSVIEIGKKFVFHYQHKDCQQPVSSFH